MSMTSDKPTTPSAEELIPIRASDVERECRHKRGPDCEYCYEIRAAEKAARRVAMEECAGLPCPPAIFWLIWDGTPMETSELSPCEVACYKQGRSDYAAAIRARMEQEEKG